MKKLFLMSAAVLLLSGVAAFADYDVRLKPIPSPDAMTSADAAATDYIWVMRKGTGSSETLLLSDVLNPVQAPLTLTTDTLDNATYSGKTLCIGSAAGTSTLPAATGSGAVYNFVVCSVPPGSGHVITVTGDDTIDGQVLSTQDSADTVVGWETAANTDTITFTSSTKMGAAIGGWVTLHDVAADQWTVRGQGTSTGSEASPFSGS
jgi:hypothetical protein